METAAAPFAPGDMIEIATGHSVIPFLRYRVEDDAAITRDDRGRWHLRARTFSGPRRTCYSIAVNAERIRRVS
jgi:hypothetical protein